jgi:hypothetical protein
LGGRHGAASPWGGRTASLTTAQRNIYSFVTAHRGAAEYLMATDSWSMAAPYILATGAEVLPVGGFSGLVPAPTLSRVQQLVRTGQLPYFLLSPPSQGMVGFGGRARGGAAVTITTWVRHSCHEAHANATAGTVYRCEG